MNPESNRQTHSIQRMYFAFFKRSMRNQSEYSPPPIAPSDEQIDEDDEELFLRSEKIFYSYYQFLKNLQTGDLNVGDLDEPIDSDDDLYKDPNSFLSDKVVNKPNAQSKYIVLYYLNFFLSLKTGI